MRVTMRVMRARVQAMRVMRARVQAMRFNVKKTLVNTEYYYQNAANTASQMQTGRQGLIRLKIIKNR